MHFTFHRLIGYVTIVLGVGLVISSFFIDWKPPELGVLGAGIGAIAGGYIYLREQNQGV